VFASVDQPGIGPLLTPASPLRFPVAPPVPPATAPLLGSHTDEILGDVLGLSAAEIGRLHDEGLVAGAAVGVASR
jgi:2-methylfumaryl-CoA isomerase